MYKKYFALLLILSVMDLCASTCCEQKFELLGLDTAKTRILYITEILSGECYFVNLWRLEINENEILDQVKRYDVGETLEKTQEQIKQSISNEIKPTVEKPIEFKYQESVWRNPLNDWQIRKTVTPPELMNRMHRSEFINGYMWNKENEERGIVNPEFIGINVMLQFYHPAGLYLDYEIDRIYYFVKSQYIVLFTRQERKGAGWDTMHGFLLFKLID
jgi:hypothetical protein